MCRCRRVATAESGATSLNVREFKLTPQPDVVSVLRRMLKLAEAGHIRAVAVAIHADRVNTGTCWALGNGDIAHLVLACQRMIRRLLQEGDE